MKPIPAFALVSLLLAAGGQAPLPTGGPTATLIRNARLIDGSGAAARSP